MPGAAGPAAAPFRSRGPPMADVTKDVVARLKVEKEGDSASFRDAAADVRDLTEAVTEAQPALEGNAEALKKSGDAADWVKQQTERILGPAREAATANRDLGESLDESGKAGERAGASFASLQGLMTALLLKIDPTKANLQQLNAAFEASIGITEKLAEVTGRELPDSYSQATAAASRFVEALATGKLSKAADELKAYMEGLREYAADTLNWIDELAGGGAKANDQLIESMTGAREQLQATIKAQREMVEVREKEIAALTQQSAVFERQIKAEQAAGEVTKQTRDAAQGLLDKWEQLGKEGPKAFEETAKQAGIFSSAIEKAAEKAAKLKEAAGEEGAAASVSELGKSLWDAGGPLADFAEEADRVTAQLAELKKTNPNATLDDVAKASTGAAESLGEATDSAEEFSTKLEESREVVDDFAESASRSLQDFAVEAKSAFDRITEAGSAANDRLFNPGLSPSSDVDFPDESPIDRAVGDLGGDGGQSAVGAAQQLDEALLNLATNTLPQVSVGLDGMLAKLDQLPSAVEFISAAVQSLAEVDFGSGLLERLGQVEAKLGEVKAAAEAAAAALAAVPEAGEGGASAAPATEGNAV